MVAKLTQSIRKFHRDEDGLEALQVVMILAITAMVLAAASTMGKAAVTWMKSNWDKLHPNNALAGSDNGWLGKILAVVTG